MTSFREQQEGVTMLVTLIALVVLLIGAIALIQSSDTASVISGNLAFKRDLTNNAERAVAVVAARFATGGDLNPETAPYASLQADNYSATMLATTVGNKGLPDALLNDTTFTSIGMSSNDIVDSASGITVRYVVDRMCTATGAVDPTTCLINRQQSDKGGTSWLRKANGGFQPIYRISIRVNGPRNTQAFVQTTLEY